MRTIILASQSSSKLAYNVALRVFSSKCELKPCMRSVCRDGCLHFSKAPAITAHAHMLDRSLCTIVELTDCALQTLDRGRSQPPCTQCEPEGSIAAQFGEHN